MANAKKKEKPQPASGRTFNNLRFAATKALDLDLRHTLAASLQPQADHNN